MQSIAYSNDFSISYSKEIFQSLPKVSTTINELRDIRPFQCNSNLSIYNGSPIDLKKAKIALERNDINLMIVLSSEIENLRKSLFDTWKVSNRQTVLVSFVPITTKHIKSTGLYLSKISNNAKRPFIYHPDGSLHNFIYDFVRNCCQKEAANKLESLASESVPSSINDFSGVLLKRIHISNKIVGDSLFIDYEKFNKDLFILPVADPNEEVYSYCLNNQVSNYYDRPIEYMSVVPINDIPLQNRYEFFRDYDFINNLNLHIDKDSQIIEKLEHVVLISSEPENIAKKTFEEFNLCLLDRYWNLLSDYITARSRNEEGNTFFTGDVVEQYREKLINYIEGYYLLSTDDIPMISYSNYFVLPKKSEYFNRIGNKYSRKFIYEQIINNNGLSNDEFAALKLSIKKYSNYIFFRKELTEKDIFDVNLLYAMERLAILKKIYFDNLFVQREPNLRDKLLDAIKTLEELSNINAKINTESNPDSLGIINSETHNHDVFSKRISDLLNQWKNQL